MGTNAASKALVSRSTISENRRCVDSLGISGGSYEQDQQAAGEALAALGFELPVH
ncbi:hypothetical protein AB5L52_43170 [Streptomyces sp. CG4]|uniref:hypothetical protein n=1 Tax=Streptomyces sp. CG4 TaxID=408783 RepID=UPI0034E2217D